MAQSGPIEITPLETQTVVVPVVGVTPLIVHRFSEKARQQIEDKQSQKSRQKKAPKVPEELFNAARYRLPDGSDGFPAVGFKAAIVSGARLLDGVTMTLLKQSIYVQGEGADQLVPLEIESEPDMRQDNVRISMGTTDLRYRPQYWPWGAVLRVTFIPSVITLSSLMSLVNAGGFGGIGEWRPTAPKSSTGSFGKFEIDKSRDLQLI